jgi:hypothetical protein
MATVQKVKLSSELRYLNDRLRDGRAVLQAGFSMKRLGNPDPAFQPRVVHLDMDHVKTLDDIYQARGALDPVVLVHVPDKDLYILVDGFHRHEVYKRAGNESIPAYVISGTIEDATEYTAMANQHAILNRTPDDVKKQVFLLLSLPKWETETDSVIGHHVGVVQKTVNRYRIMFYAEKGVPIPERSRKRRGPGAAMPGIYKCADGVYRACFRGRTFHLGKSPGEAQRRLKEKLGQIEQRRSLLNENDFFGSWLPRRGVALSASRFPINQYPGIGQSAHGFGRIVIVARLNEPSAIYPAIGRLYALREIHQRLGDRLVMVCVCYPDDGPDALVEVARRLGVELLTPEELIVSIKGEEAGREDGS